MLGNLGRKALANIAIHLAKDNLPGLVSNLTSSAINKLERKNKWERSCEQEKDLLDLFRMKNE